MKMKYVLLVLLCISIQSLYSFELSKKVEIESNVGMPIIQVSDWYFPPTNVGTPAYGQFDVKNVGSVDLEIYGYKGPFIEGKDVSKKIYKSDDLEYMNISETNHLVIKPGHTIAFALRFIPDDTLSYPDSIMFISNTIKTYPPPNWTGVDSVCSFSGKGLMSSLTATSYNWERKRIHRPGKFEMGPYPATKNLINPDTCIRLYNGGNASLSVYRIKDINKIGDVTAFKFDKSEIIGKDINANAESIIEVTFQPEQAGSFVYTFEYETNNPSITGIQTQLMGIGIVPKLQTEDKKFSSELYDYLNPTIENVLIKNMDSSDWNYGDSVVINDLEFNNISTDVGLGWDGISESFRVDKSAITFPIRLHQGDSLLIPIEFVARGKNAIKASITTVSDAEAEVTALLIGHTMGEPDAVAESNDELNIYPNPANDILVIEKLPYSTNKISIFDESGKEIKSINIMNAQQYVEVSTQNFPQSTYILRIYTNNCEIDKKFIVIH